MSGLGNKEIMSANLKYYLNLNGKKPADLSRDLDFPYTTVDGWVKANTYPRIDRIEMMANYFRIQKSNLIEERNPNNPLTPIHYKKLIPILGRISAGVPPLATENIEGYENVEDENIDYGLIVSGDSMINARICEDDIVYVIQDAEIKNGDIVIALINGDDATIKRFYKYDNEVILKPENPTMEEQHYKPEEVQVLGKVLEAKIRLR